MTTAAQIIRDLRVFSDPATEFRSNETAKGLRVTLTRDGRDRTYLFNLGTSEVVARHQPARRFSSLEALLASDEFVDLRSFRATQRRILAGKKPETYIEPEGELFAKDGNGYALTLDSFRRAVARGGNTNLSILLLDGPAGIGKTSLIERIVYERSDPASPTPPLLHVASSGSRLTDLSKALAHATQMLRSRITFDQVPVLVRLGVLQVAIDGFDELVDPEGYKDAWSALRQFLADVNIGGPIVLSGRDTFFDQQSFEQRLASRISNLELSHARLHPVSPVAAKSFLRNQGWSEKDFKSAEARDWLRPGSYYLRPFFLAQIGRTGGWRELMASHGSPQSFLVTQFVTREALIVARMVDVDSKKAEDALWEFYGLVVEDMASQETDTIDEAFLALACETAFQSRVSPQDLAKLVSKAGSFGLLESDGGGDLRRFPHSELQNQFLARVVIQGLESSSAVSIFLRRGVVSTALLEAFSDAYEGLDSERAKTVRTRLGQFVTDEPFSERLMSNCGALLLATLSRVDLPQLDLSSVAITDAKIVGTAANALLDGVSFTHLDTRGADCRGIEFRDCSVTTLTVDNATAFGRTQPNGVQTLQLEIQGAVQAIRDPQELREWLEKHSIAPAETERPEDLPFVRYFDRLCRKFARQHQIRANPKDEGYFLLQDAFWPDVLNIVGKRIVQDTRAARGPKNAFFRMVRPESLIAPLPDDEDSIRIRQEIVDRARELAN